MAYCQMKNDLSVVYGFAGNSIGSIGIGGPGYEGKGEDIYGLNYRRSLTKCFSFETGIEYSVNNVLWNYVDAYQPNFRPQPASIRMLSIPVYANFSFFKYLFADAGVIADFETNHQSDKIISNQSGIGIGIGIGGQYYINKMILFVNPFLQSHAIVAYNNKNGGQLYDQGVKFGVGYRF